MGNLGKVVYLTEAQKQTLFTDGTITVGGVTITYSANDLYVTPQDDPVTDVQINGTSIVSSGVANIPIASGTTLGTVKGSSSSGAYGITIESSGELRVYHPNDTLIKEGSNGYRPLVPSDQHKATFYGLAKASGDTSQASSSNAVGTYTESAKSAIASMLDAPEIISGTTPSITAKAGVRYICGEVATLTITPPASGDIEVIFDSGSTATVLSVPNTVKFPAWFDPTDLEANVTYDIIITNGTLGVVGSWT